MFTYHQRIAKVEGRNFNYAAENSQRIVKKVSIVGRTTAVGNHDGHPRLENLFAQHWPEEAAGLATREAIETTISNTAADLEDVLRRLHRRLTWARSTRSELHRKKDTGLIEKEEDPHLVRPRALCPPVGRDRTKPPKAPSCFAKSAHAVLVDAG